jgi:hypothetical protein
VYVLTASNCAKMRSKYISISGQCVENTIRMGKVPSNHVFHGMRRTPPRSRQFPRRSAERKRGHSSTICHRLPVGIYDTGLGHQIEEGIAFIIFTAGRGKYRRVTAPRGDCTKSILSVIEGVPRIRQPLSRGRHGPWCHRRGQRASPHVHGAEGAFRGKGRSSCDYLKSYGLPCLEG